MLRIEEERGALRAKNEKKQTRLICRLFVKISSKRDLGKIIVARF